MPTTEIAVVVAIVIVSALLAVVWFRGVTWPLGVLVLIMSTALIAYAISQSTVALVFATSSFAGLALSVGVLLWALDRMLKEESAGP
jgi:hypothetical protein